MTKDLSFCNTDIKNLIMAVREFYSDTSRSRDESRDDLQELRDEINIMLESLDD